mmetsp:Transcript_100714/g.307874  ORF Transcript_100714/g.307874 Transcript_100714/m.307874 type:complete len:248 (-) Transcript_100714:889-1632(-)
MPAVQDAVQLLIRGTFQALHELHDRVLLLLEKPPNPLADIRHPLLQWLVGVVVEQLHHHVRPRHRAHGDAEGLEDVPLLRLDADLREAEEGLDLEHQPGELGPAVDGDLERGHLDVAAQVLDVVLQTAEIRRRQRLERQVAAELLVVTVEIPQLVVERHAIDVGPNDALHDVRKAVREGHPAGADGGEHLRGVALLDLLLELLRPLGHRRLEVPKLRQHRPDRLNEHALGPLLHVTGEVVETHGVEV